MTQTQTQPKAGVYIVKVKSTGRKTITEYDPNSKYYAWIFLGSEEGTRAEQFDEEYKILRKIRL